MSAENIWCTNNVKLQKCYYITSKTTEIEKKNFCESAKCSSWMLPRISVTH